MCAYICSKWENKCSVELYKCIYPRMYRDNMLSLTLFFGVPG